MPCNDAGMDDYYRREREDKMRVLAKVACAALQYLDDHKIPVPPECAAWWEAHKEADTLRNTQIVEALMREDARVAARNKLTDVERKILGI